jgi:hypothetical protein
MSDDKVLDIRLKLDGDVAQRFLEIKKAKGLKNETEVLRLIINEYYQEKSTRFKK